MNLQIIVKVAAKKRVMFLHILYIFIIFIDSFVFYIFVFFAIANFNLLNAQRNFCCKLIWHELDYGKYGRDCRSGSDCGSSQQSTVDSQLCCQRCNKPQPQSLSQSPFHTHVLNSRTSVVITAT